MLTPGATSYLHQLLPYVMPISWAWFPADWIVVHDLRSAECPKSGPSRRCISANYKLCYLGQKQAINAQRRIYSGMVSSVMCGSQTHKFSSIENLTAAVISYRQVHLFPRTKVVKNLPFSCIERFLFAWKQNERKKGRVHFRFRIFFSFSASSPRW